ncbi:Glutaredoxin [Coemansia aciculifera]|uniref:Glutaredoxin n=1 Tax=Coemansia aciculifera TaxID=417176 RepID=A0ACC1MAZ0_9FUNG|nr:Glutaredoxin [Coemansia aciculifera]
MSKVSTHVSRLISQNAVMVFSKSYCPYCTRAKDELSKRKIAFKAVELDKTQDGSDIQAYLLQLTKQRTVPNIFANGHHVGGCDATLDKLASGAFQTLLKGKKGEFAIAEKPEQSTASSKEESETESERPVAAAAETPSVQPEGKGKAAAEPAKLPKPQSPVKNTANVFPPAA